MSVSIEGRPGIEISNQRELLSPAQISLLVILRDRGLGVVDVRLKETYPCSHSLVEFDLFPEDENLYQGINRSINFRALDRATFGGGIIPENEIRQAEFDERTKKRLLLTYFTTRAEAFLQLSKERGVKRDRKEECEMIAAENQKRITEILAQDPGLQSLNQDEVLRLLNEIVDKALGKEGFQPPLVYSY